MTPNTLQHHLQQTFHRAIDPESEDALIETEINVMATLGRSTKMTYQPVCGGLQVYVSPNKLLSH